MPTNNEQGKGATQVQRRRDVWLRRSIRAIAFAAMLFSAVGVTLSYSLHGSMTLTMNGERQGVYVRLSYVEISNLHVYVSARWRAQGSMDRSSITVGREHRYFTTTLKWWFVPSVRAGWHDHHGDGGASMDLRIPYITTTLFAIFMLWLGWRIQRWRADGFTVIAEQKGKSDK